MTMYCQAAMPLGDRKTFTKIGAMTRTIAMSYASSINPRNWEAIAIFVCLDNFCSAIRNSTDRVASATSEGPAATDSRFTGGAYGFKAYKSGQKCSLGSCSSLIFLPDRKSAGGGEGAHPPRR